MDDGQVVIGGGSSSSGNVSGESEMVASLKNDQFDEWMKAPHIGIVELSRQRAKKRRSVSMQISKSLNSITPLEKDTGSKGWHPMFQDDQKDLTEIDRMDVGITHSTQTISKLRKKSLYLLTDVGDSSDSDQVGKH